LLKKQELENHQKKGKTEEDTQMPTYHDGKHRPTMPRRKFEANLENFGKIYDPIKQR
jgi:hypothetical protein